ncbi:MAG: hypothetical protein ACM3ZV_02115 [Bacillota bacterium]
MVIESSSDEALSAADLRKLAAKCRRFALTMSDGDTAATFRRMAAEYEGLACSKERWSAPGGPGFSL